MGKQVYELSASTTSEYRVWLSHLASAIDAQTQQCEVLKQHLPARALVRDDPGPTTPTAATAAAAAATQNFSTAISQDDSATITLDDDEFDDVERSRAPPDQLISPSNINVRQAEPLELAELILTTAERLRRRDHLVEQALSEKMRIVSETMSLGFGVDSPESVSPGIRLVPECFLGGVGSGPGEISLMNVCHSA